MPVIVINSVNKALILFTQLLYCSQPHGSLENKIKQAFQIHFCWSKSLWDSAWDEKRSEMQKSDKDELKTVDGSAGALETITRFSELTDR